MKRFIKKLCKKIIISPVIIPLMVIVVLVCAIVLFWADDGVSLFNDIEFFDGIGHFMDKLIDWSNE